MPNETTLAKRQLLAEVANQIDEIASGVQLYEAADGGLAKQLAVATAIVDMRALLTPEVMQPVMALMNTGLGFATDQDPSRPSRTNANPKPYSVEQVREVVIEAKLRGFNLVGQEFNIIAGKFYACKNGLSRKVRDLRQHGVSKFRDFYDLPIISADGQSARVKCRAQWEQAGKVEKVEFEFFIKLHGMGADAALGKAERRLAKEVLKFLTGDTTPAGDVDDAPEDPSAAAKPATVRVRTIADHVPTDTEGKTTEVRTNVANDQIPGAETPAQQPEAAPEQQATKQAPPAPPSNSRLANFRKFLADSGISEKSAMDQIHKMFTETDSLGTLEDVEAMAPNVINAILRARVNFVNATRQNGGAS